MPKQNYTESDLEKLSLEEARKLAVELQREVKALQHQNMLYQAVLDALPQAVFWKDPDLVYYGSNRIFAEHTGFTSPNMLAGKTDYDLSWKPEETEAYRADDKQVIVSGQPKYHIIEPLRKASGEEIWLETNKAPLRDPAGHIRGVVGTYEDVTTRRHAEDEQKLKMEQLIRAQAATLAEISTPLIPVAAGLLVMPLVGSIDGNRAEQIVETLLDGVSRLGAKTVILDVTGVKMVDTNVANTMIRATQAVRLLGASIWLTGIRAEVAQTLVRLGVDLGQLVVRSTLQNAIAYALKSEKAAPSL
jgi:rsbT co-antagonist protein RsbR